jgi:enoyl-CoA hydratase/carnithine racemase
MMVDALLSSHTGKVAVSRDGAVLHVVLSRPEKLNALDTDVLTAIANVFNAVNHDFSVRAVLLRGQGRAFSAGADRKNPPGSERMSKASGANDRERRQTSQIGLRATAAIAECEVPVVAAIQGWCVGGGLALALSCDFRVATADAQFSIPEVDLGIPLAWGATPRLINEIGAARARELIMLCDTITAHEASQYGLVHRVVDSDQLVTVASDLAIRLSSKPEMAMHETKTQFRAYEARSMLGNVTETDGDLMVQASRSDTAQRAFNGLS